MSSSEGLLDWWPFSCIELPIIAIIIVLFVLRHSYSLQQDPVISMVIIEFKIDSCYSFKSYLLILGTIFNLANLRITESSEFDYYRECFMEFGFVTWCFGFN